MLRSEAPEGGSNSWNSDGVSTSLAMARLALPVHAQMSADTCLYLGRQALELATGSGQRLLVAVAGSNLGIAALATGAEWGWQSVESAMSIADDLGDQDELGRIVTNAMAAALWLGDYARAERLLGHGRAVAHRAAGQWPALDLDLLEADLLFRTKGATGRVAAVPAGTEHPVFSLLLGRVALRAGDTDWAQLHLVSVADRGFDEGYPHLAAAASADLALIALEGGDPDGAISWAARAVAPARDGAAAWWGDTLPHAIRVLSALGMLDRCEELLAAAVSGLARASAPRAEAALVYAHGILAEARGSAGEARTCYHRARKMFARLPEPAMADEIVDALTAMAPSRHRRRAG